MATRGELSERILRVVYNGTPPNDASIDIREVGLHINSAIATLARVNFIENYKLDGSAFVDGGFIMTFKNEPVTKDDDLGLKYLTLPASPVGLPKDRGIVEISMMKNKSTTPVIMVNSNRRSVYQGLDPIKNRIIGWQEGDKVYFDGATADFSKALVKLVAYASNDMNAELNMPKNLEEQVIDIVVKKLMTQRSIPQDKVIDGNDSLIK